MYPARIAPSLKSSGYHQLYLLPFPHVTPVYVVSIDHVSSLAVVLGAVLRVIIDDRRDEILDGGVEGMAAELFNVGDGFEGLHGGSPVVIEGVYSGSAAGLESVVARC